MEHTINRVKEAMPIKANCKFPDGTVIEGNIVGKNLDFPEVSVPIFGTTLNAEITWNLAERILDGKSDYVRM